MPEARHSRLLTDTFIRGLKPPQRGQQALYWDSKVPGFGVRLTAGGAASFILYTRWPPSYAPARRVLGDAKKLSLAAARQKARDWLNEIEQGVDPFTEIREQQAAVQREQRITFAKVAEDWLEDAVRGKQRKAHEVETDVRREFIPRWGNRPVTDITALDVRDAIREVKDRAPAQARNLLGYAKRLFAWAEAQHVYGIKEKENPAERLKPKAIIGKKVERHRVLNDIEMRALWHASDKLGYPYGDVFRLLALTGQRKSEVAEAQWREFDLTKKLWTIPPERMKGAAAHEVPLTDDAMAILEALPRFNSGDYVFSTTFGAKPVNGFSKAKVNLDRAMAVELGGAVDPFVIHDIRRTMRTGLSALPIPDRVRELVIAHAQPGLHKIYDQHSYRQEKLHALNLWAARLRNIVNPPRPTENLLHFRGTGG